MHLMAQCLSALSPSLIHTYSQKCLPCLKETLSASISSPVSQVPPFLLKHNSLESYDLGTQINSPALSMFCPFLFCISFFFLRDITPKPYHALADSLDLHV